MAVPSNIYPSANKIIPRIYSGGCGNAFNRTFFNPMRGWTSTQTIGRDIGHFLNGHRGYTRQICMNNYSNPFNFGFGVCGETHLLLVIIMDLIHLIACFLIVHYVE